VWAPGSLTFLTDGEGIKIPVGGLADGERRSVTGRLPRARTWTLVLILVGMVGEVLDGDGR